MAAFNYAASAAEGRDSRGLAARGSGDLPRQRLRHFSGLGKAARRAFGEDQLAVEGDFEDAVLPFDQGGLDVELVVDLVRQTGGSGLVVSNHAVLDLHLRH